MHGLIGIVNLLKQIQIGNNCILIFVKNFDFK